MLVNEIFITSSTVILRCRWLRGCALWSSRSRSQLECLNISLTPCLWTERWLWSRLLKVCLFIIFLYEWSLLTEWHVSGIVKQEKSKKDFTYLICEWHPSTHLSLFMWAFEKILVMPFPSIVYKKCLKPTSQIFGVLW